MNFCTGNNKLFLSLKRAEGVGVKKIAAIFAAILRLIF
jgi:hypothetical protein